MRQAVGKGNLRGDGVIVGELCGLMRVRADGKQFAAPCRVYGDGFRLSGR